MLLLYNSYLFCVHQVHRVYMPTPEVALWYEFNHFSMKEKEQGCRHKWVQNTQWQLMHLGLNTVRGTSCPVYTCNMPLGGTSCFAKSAHSH